MIVLRLLLLRLLLLLIAALLVFCLGSLYFSKHGLMVSRYTIASEKLSSPVKVVQLSDLHNSVFGSENEKLVEKIRAEEPDLIFLTGDMLNNNDPDTYIALSLIDQLTEIAPVYASYGNHEKDFERIYDVDLAEEFERAGAVMLERDWVDISVNGNDIRIGGIYGYCLPPKYLKTGETRQDEYDYVTAFTDTDAYCMLLAHMPVCWMINGALDGYDADSVWAGHSHGGQIILPFFGGLYAPDRGWLVGREWGVYDSQDGQKHLILSRGLGTNKKLPRMNNIPEIVSVTITPAK